MPKKSKPGLSELEHTVMCVVWSQGQVTAEVVRTKLARKQPMKDSTVRTILRRLEEKGYVCHATEGRTYVYSPTEPSQSVAADAVRRIVERFCNGSVEDLLVGMVDREVVSPEKLHELARRIASEKASPKRKSKGEGRRRGKGN